MRGADEPVVFVRQFSTTSSDALAAGRLPIQITPIAEHFLQVTLQDMHPCLCKLYNVTALAVPSSGDTRDFCSVVASCSVNKWVLIDTWHYTDMSCLYIHIASLLLRW